ncbi:hypothetical protein K2X30_11035 [bacterium]|nr:hypothetical protein [bacterium]
MRSRKLRVLSGILASILLVGGILFFERNRIKNWLEERLIRAQIRKLEQKYPIRITEFAFDEPWVDILSGKFSDLKITVEFEFDSRKWKAHLFGPVHLVQAKGSPEYHLEYSAVTTFETGKHFMPMKTEIWVGLKDLSHFTEFGITLGGSKFEIPGRGYSIHDFVADGIFDGEDFEFDLSAKKVVWNDPARPEDSPHTLQIKDVEFRAQDPDDSEGTIIEAQLKANVLEGFWEDVPFSAPLASIPAFLRVNFDPKTKKPKRFLFDLGVKQPYAVVAEGDFQTRELRWETQPLPLKKLIPEGLELPYQFKRGTLHTQGRGRWNELEKMVGSLNIRDLEIAVPKSDVVVSGVKLSLPIENGTIRNGEVAIRDLWYKRVHGKLGTTPIRLIPEAGSEARKVPTWKVSVGTKSGIPLSFEGAKLSLASLEGTLQKPKGKEIEADLKTALKLEPLPLPSLAKGFCQEESKVVPASISIDFPKISVTQESIVPEEGTAKVEVFGGSMDISEIAIYDYLSDVPEFDFDLHWEKIDVSKFARWTSFGRMDGYLQGYAEDVKVLSWLPTHFDFKIEIVPNKHEVIVLSSNAMRNFVRLFAKDELEQLPEIAKWFYFGTPGQIFDYSAQYVGLKAFSDEGSILLETLDPKSDSVTDIKLNHYILYGTRFKILLKGSRYPLVVDAHAMANFVRHVTDTLKTISKEGKTNEGATTPPQPKPEPEIQKCVPENSRG